MVLKPHLPFTVVTDVNGQRDEVSILRFFLFLSNYYSGLYEQMLFQYVVRIDRLKYVCLGM